MDLTSDTTASLCLQDLGNTLHPQILAPIETPFLRQEASGLAQIHHANGAEEGVWLPRLDREYIALQLHYRFWRPWWKALKNQDFVHTFKPYLMLLETAAQQIEEEMEVLYQDKEAWTLIHADIHPGNVLIWQDSPFFIDWATAHRGPFYLDLPRHFFPLERAEIYRQERERLGDHFSHADFCERYRIAARYIGLRKTWEYLQAFYTSRDTTLAYYYIQMVLHS
jgi:thiamine kinase-like enzyme